MFETGHSSAATDHSSHPSIFVHRTSHLSLTLHVGLYELILDYQDGYVAFMSVQRCACEHIACWACMVGRTGQRQWAARPHVGAGAALGGARVGREAGEVHYLLLD